MQHEYGVKRMDIEWVISAKDSCAGVSGSVPKLENVIPEGLHVRTGSRGKEKSEILVNGEVDALLHAIEPKPFIEGNAFVGRLFADFRSVA